MGIAVGLRIVRGQSAVVESDGVLTFNANAFGQVRSERRAVDDYISGGINCGRAETVRRVRTARDRYIAAASVSSYRRGRLSARRDNQIFCNGIAAARRHDSARTAC